MRAQSASTQQGEQSGFASCEPTQAYKKNKKQNMAPEKGPKKSPDKRFFHNEALASIQQTSVHRRQDLRAEAELLKDPKPNKKMKYPPGVEPAAPAYVMDERAHENQETDRTDFDGKLIVMDNALTNFQPAEGKMTVFDSSSPQGKHLEQMFDQNAYMVKLENYRFVSPEYNGYVLKKMVFFVVPDTSTGMYTGYTENMQQFHSNDVANLVDLAAETHSKIATAKPRRDILIHDAGKGEEDLAEIPDQKALNVLSTNFEEYIHDQKGLSLTKQVQKGKSTPSYMLRLKNYQFQDLAGDEFTIDDKYFLVELDADKKLYKSYYKGGVIYARTPKELVGIAAELSSEAYEDEV